jgi:eukaryotic-like serine/threonine-protein kinase
MAAESLPKTGDLIDRYQVVAEVARGGMAAVFAVRRQSLGGFEKMLAMKVLLPSVTSQRQAVERLLDEARIASHIDHPSVLGVLDVFEHEGLPCILMELLRGQSLSQLARAAKRKGVALPLGLRLAMLARVAEGLAAAHATLGADGEPLGVVHRDVSPQNIHVGYDGEVKVVDFGIAAARGRLADTTTGEFRGKLAYASPEQLTRKSAIDRHTDVFALGIVAWELLSGRRLFRGEDERDTIFNVLERPVPDLSSVAPTISPKVSEVVMRCLERDRERRRIDCSEVGTVLDAAAAAAGGDRRQDIAAFMTLIFAEERAAENERLAAASRGDLVPPMLQPDPNPSGTGGGSLTALSGAAGGQRRSRVAVMLALAVAGGAALVAAAAWVVTRGSSGPAASASGASAEGPDAAASLVRLRLHLPEDVQLVLVDGKRRDERPLVLALPPNGSAKVELIAGDGRTLERTVTSADDDVRLELPLPAASAIAAPSSAPSASPAAEQKPKPKVKSGIKSTVGATVKHKNETKTGPLLSDPY